MVFHAPLITVLCAACLLAGAPDEKQALKRLRQAFRAAKDPVEVFEARDQALKAAARFDSPRAARALAGAYQVLETEAAAIEGRRQSIVGRGRARVGLRTRQQLDADRKLQDRILRRVARLKRPATVLWLLGNVATAGKQPLSLRAAAVAQAPAAGPEGVAVVSKHLARAKSVTELCLQLDTVAHLGPSAHTLGDRTIELLDHPDVGVRVRAARALSTLCLPASLEPLINRLETETGRARLEVAEALETLTRMNLGTSLKAWRQWLANEGRAFLAGTQQLGGGKPNVKVEPQAGYYFDIPQDGKSIIYVVDRSLSMKAKLKSRDQTRLDRLREELCAALGKLRPATEFNIIAFANQMERFSVRMRKATPENVLRAQEWVRSRPPKFGTATYDALDYAFTTAGRGTFDRHYATGVDTIFLLTDGRPTIPKEPRGLGPDDANRIVSAVSRWNALGRIVVHTIALGNQVRGNLLARLAKENGGLHVQHK